MGQPILVLIVTIVIISAVVGAIAQFLNKLNEAKAPPPRRPPGPARGDAVRQADRDMDRFLAEIDRLRRKNAEAADPQAQPAQAGGPPAGRPAQADGGSAGRPTPPPVVRPAPTRQTDRDRPRARVVAELAEKEPPKPRRRAVDTSPMAPPPLPVAPGSLSPSTRVEDLPVATVVTPTSATGAPATRVTRLPQRARPTPKTDLAQNLTSLLNSGHGVATAVILQAILGPPKCKPRG